MKNVRKVERDSDVLASARLWIAFWLLLLPLSGAGQQLTHKMTKKDLAALSASAKTPQDHLKLAAYYREEAAENGARQKEHLAMEQKYLHNPQMYATKYPSAAEHCRQWAAIYGQYAERDVTLAEMHELLAQELAQ